MKPVITEYHGVKYSLRPHGLKSRLIVLKRSALIGVAAFIVALGSALLAATPAQAAPGDCFVEVIVTDSNGRTSPSNSPTTCAAAAAPPAATVTVTATETVTAAALPAVTVTETAMSTVTETALVTQTETKTTSVTVEVPVTVTTTVTAQDNPPTISAIPRPSRTPDPIALKPSLAGDSGGAGDGGLAWWGIAVAIVLGIGLAVVGFVGIIKNRRRAQYQGSHAAAEEEEPTIRSSGYDPDATGVIPAVSSDTKVFPRVEADDDHQAGR